MQHDIKTPLLKEVSDGLMTVFRDALAGRADHKDGALVVRAGGEVTRVVEVDLKKRLVAPKLAKIEGAE